MRGTVANAAGSVRPFASRVGVASGVDALEQAAAALAARWSSRRRQRAVIDVFVGTTSVSHGPLSESELFRFAREVYRERFFANEKVAWGGSRPAAVYYGEQQKGMFALASTFVSTQRDTAVDTIVAEVSAIARAVGPDEGARNPDGTGNSM